MFNKIENIYKRPADGFRIIDSVPNPEFVSVAETVNSKITKDFDFIRSLFPPNRKIKKFNIIFRASENDFSAEAFHRKCDNTPNTLLLLET